MESLLLLHHHPHPFLHRSHLHPSLHLPSFVPSALKKSRGFGSSKTQKTQPKNPKKNQPTNQEEPVDDDEDDTVPEIVTNRMIGRMALSVGAPLTVGLLFFPFFYYLKVVAKVDVPNWVPFLVSLTLFGAAFLGVTYGIVSASWDPLREGSLLGWNEARRNWPVFLESIRGKNK